MPNIISLVGMMGCGKTSVGEYLAQQLNIKLIDLDQEIESRKNITILEIFAQKGEQEFRKIETNILKEIIAEQDNIVLSSGGGAFLKQENRDLLLENSEVFWLDADSKTIHERIKLEEGRPLLAQDNSQQKIEEILTKRIPFYNMAHHKITTNQKDISDISNEILMNLKEKWKK